MTIESDELSGRVDSFESRASDQQAARDRLSGGWSWLFFGVGIVVVLIGATFGQLGSMIVVAYWVGGPLIFLALRRLYLDPHFDTKFPLSRSRHARRIQKRREAKAGSESKRPADSAARVSPFGEHRAR